MTDDFFALFDIMDIVEQMFNGNGFTTIPDNYEVKGKDGLIRATYDIYKNDTYVGRIIFRDKFLTYYYEYDPRYCRTHDIDYNCLDINDLINKFKIY